MRLAGLRPALNRDLSVLFAYIGWAKKYDGTEAIKGTHGYLKKHPHENSEARGFVKGDDGLFRCGIGRGEVTDRIIHVVFVARERRHGPLEVVGIYAAADVEMEADGVWANVTTRKAVLIPASRRPVVGSWPGSQGIRRWARRDDGKSHPALLRFFERLRADLPRIMSGARQRLPDDQTYCDLEALEGEPYRHLVTHRRREAKLRAAKISAALIKANNGHLMCEVPRCGFDFVARYGEIGYGYAHVHHCVPLAKARRRGQKTTLDDLAIVCANCHAMIHKGGECRELGSLIPRKRRKD